MSCCWLWLFCAYPLFFVDKQLSCWPRRVISLRIALDKEKGRASWRQVGLPAQSLPRSRFRRACIPACVHVIRVCVCMCMYVCVLTCIYLYICTCICIYLRIHVYNVHMYVYAYLCIDCETQYPFVSVFGRCYSCACVFLWICLRVHMCVCIYMCN